MGDVRFKRPPQGTDCVLLRGAAASPPIPVRRAVRAGRHLFSTQIIAGYNEEVRTELVGMGDNGGTVRLEMIPKLWYNPLLDYKIYMFSGILVLIVTLIGMLLTALNLVREKEMGTTEQINVTPIRKYQFIMAKLLPFMIIALFELTFGLLIGRLLFNLPIVGRNRRQNQSD